jgi:hypothetical protein
MLRAAFLPSPMAAVALRAQGIMSPPAKTPTAPVIMSVPTWTAPSAITRPG